MKQNKERPKVTNSVAAEKSASKLLKTNIFNLLAIFLDIYFKFSIILFKMKLMESWNVNLSKSLDIYKYISV